MEAVDMVLCLAGSVPGKEPMSVNSALALAAVECAIALGANHIFLSSSAAVYGPCATPLTEQSPLCPQTTYGQSKLDMENAALALAAHNGLGATALRIGNVAGADSLLAQDRSWRILDRFDSGAGPVRSYIGPQAFCATLYALMLKTCSGAPLPAYLNVALQGGVAMTELCAAAQLEVRWRAAPATAVDTVVLDVTRLAYLVELPHADAKAIVADFEAYRDTLICKKQAPT